MNHAFFHEAPAVRAFDLVAGQQDRAPRVLPDHLEVSQHRSPIEHPARRHDDLAAQCQLAFPRIPYDVGAVHRLSQRLNGAYVLRALDIDRVHFLPHPIQPYLVMSLRERQEDVLRSANREGGDEREAAAVHHLFDLPQECVLRLEPLRTLSPKSIVRYLRRAVRRSPSSNGASKPSASAIFRESAKRRSATSAVGGVRTTSTSCRRVTHGIIPVWSRWAWLMNIPSTGGAGIGYCGGSRGSSP